jgi:hypothetical protein
MPPGSHWRAGRPCKRSADFCREVHGQTANGPVSIPARARSGGFFVSQAAITSGQLEIFLSATIRSASSAAQFAFLRYIDCCMVAHGDFSSIAERRLVLDTIDTVEKLDFLPRSQFLRQQAGFKKKALRGRQKG